MDLLLQDLRHSVRSLVRSPGFTTLAILTLAIAIGANSALFSVVYGVLLRPLPYDQPDRLVVVARQSSQTGEPSPVSLPDFQSWRRLSATLEDLAAWAETDGDLTWNERAEQVAGARVSHNLFSVLGVAPRLGRTFSATEDRRGGPRVVLLSHALWASRFASDPAIVGRSLRLDAASYEIVGVMPPIFAFPATDAQYWLPLQDDALLAASLGEVEDLSSVAFLSLVGRLQPGVGAAAAQKELAALADEHDGPQVRAWLGSVGVRSLQRSVVGEVAPLLLTLMGAVGLVLLVACANVANLLLARGIERRQAITVRLALGATRARVVRQLLTESTVMAGAGGLAGYGLAILLTDLLRWLAADTLPRVGEVRPDATVLAFTAGAVILSVTLSGLLPALSASRQRMTVSARVAGGGSATGGRLQSGLVVTQVALATVLMLGAGLLVHSFDRLTAVDPGFDATGVLTARVSLPRERYGEERLVRAFYNRLSARLAALPGVEAAGTTSDLPFGPGGVQVIFEAEGQPRAEDEQPWAKLHIVGDGYLAALGRPLLAGRGLGSQDGAEAPAVAVVSRHMAQLAWPGESALGKRFRLGGDTSEEGWHTVVGVVEDARGGTLNEQISPSFLLSRQQLPWRTMGLVVRSGGDTAALAEPLRRVVWDLDPELPVTDVETLTARLDASVAGPRFRTAVLAFFALLALAVATAGVHGLVAFSVARRRFEIGLRMALGAERGRVLRSVLGRMLRLAAIGLALGLAASLLTNHLVAAFLFGVTTEDPVTYLAALATLLATLVLAAMGPARRASGVDPAAVLRGE